MQPTTDDLKSAFKRSYLRRMGWTFKEAMECKATRIGLTALARIAMKKAAASGNPAPTQPDLI